MVVIMKREFTPQQLETAIHAMEAGGVRVMVSQGTETTILGAEGDAGALHQEQLAQLDGVDWRCASSSRTSRLSALGAA